MANIVYFDNFNFFKNNYYYGLATEFVPNPPPMLPAHRTGIANSGSNGHYFAPDTPVANYNPQAPTVGVHVANGLPKCRVASPTLVSATALPPAALSGHVMPNFPHTLIDLGPFANQDCTVVFTQTAVPVYHPDGHPILSGWQDETGPRLWHFPLTAEAAYPQDAAGATAPLPPIPALSLLLAPPPSVTQLPPPPPTIIPPAVSAALHSHPSQGILATDTSKIACFVYYYTAQPRLLPWPPVPQVPHLTHAALISPALVPWLGSIMPAWASLSSKLGLMQSKLVTAAPLRASLTPMRPSTVRTPMR
jgi:hypothetical protein